jgi:uncharacterized repeat protein (TIGR02543 family)
VIFEANDGTTPTSEKVTAGSTVEKPTDPTREGFDFVGWYSDEALTQDYAFTDTPVTANITLYAKWSVPQATIDTIITAAIPGINATLTSNGTDNEPYALLETMDEDSALTVVVYSDIEDDDSDGISVVQAYKDIMGVLLNSLTSSTDYVSSIRINQGTDAVTPVSTTASDDDIIAFVNTMLGTSLNSSQYVINLYTKSFTVTVDTTTGDSYAYTVSFRKGINEYTIDSIIRGGIAAVNMAMSSKGNYAKLGSLGADNSVTVTISNGSYTVTNVYSDIISVLLDKLQENTDNVSYITIGQGDDQVRLDLDGITVDHIEDFVKKCGLHDVDDNNETKDLSGATKLQALYSPESQSFTATVHTVAPEDTYSYTVTFVDGTSK